MTLAVPPAARSPAPRIDPMHAIAPTDQVVLLTERLILRRTTQADVALIYEANRQLNADYDSAPALGPEELAELHAHFDAEWTARGIGYFIAIEAASGLPVGHVRLKWLEGATPGRMAELIYAIHPAYQSRGFATEAVREVLSYAFAKAGLDYVIACIEPDNAASLAVARRNRMTAVSQGLMHGRIMTRHLISAKAWAVLMTLHGR
jgi:ribosomal-protein-alanine N-acetyltransferase